MEIHLLKKEIEAQGELITQERLERKDEIGRLRLELATLKRFFARLRPGFNEEYAELHAREMQEWNPETEKPVRPARKGQGKP